MNHKKKNDDSVPRWVPFGKQPKRSAQNRPTQKPIETTNKVITVKSVEEPVVLSEFDALRLANVAKITSEQTQQKAFANSQPVHSYFHFT
jgi:hypothetical protein